MISTISGTAQNSSTFGSIFNNPFVAYVISPAIVFAIILWLAYNLLHLGELKEKFNQVLKDIESLKDDVKKLVNDVTVIKTHEIDTGGLAALAFGPGSPLKLLPRGIQILENSGFKKIYEDNKDWFVDEVKKYNPVSLSDIDDACFEFVTQCGTDNKFADYKEIAFQNGVSLDILLKVLSIYLRDEVKEEVLSEKK